MIAKSLVVIISLTLCVFGSEPVAFIKNLQGNATLKRGAASQPTQKGEYLFNGDRIETAKNANIGISFNDGTRVAVGPESLFFVDNYLFQPSKKTFHFDVSLPKGKAVFETGSISKLAPEKVNIKVPQGIIGVRGTKFAVEAN